MADLSDDDIHNLARGGHDFKKVYAGFKAAYEYKGKPCAILVKTIKGYGLGTAGESMNIAHNSHHMDIDQLKTFRDRFNLPPTDEQVETLFYHPGEKSEEVKYLKQKRSDLGGNLPARHDSKVKRISQGIKILQENYLMAQLVIELCQQRQLQLEYFQP